MSVTAI